MGKFKEYRQYDALGLADLVRRGEVSPSELVEEAIERIEAHNPHINAVVGKIYEDARSAAAGDLPQGPFSGVPFLLKDLVAAYAGAPLTQGSKAYRDDIPDYDSELVARFKQAGTIILGKTNTPEFGLKGVTEPDLHGPTRNPWNTEYTPGGSSGGSAAAIAGGMVPMASGGDGGGSLRIPAAYCGLFGFKPTRGRVPTGPVYGEKWQGAVVEHVISRSVRDSAAMLDAVQGADPGAPYVIAGPSRPYLEEVEREPRPLKIAFTRHSPLGEEMHPECIRAVDEAVTLLEEMGHYLEEKTPPLDGEKIASCYFMLYCGEVCADIVELKMKLGRNPVPADVEVATWMFNILGRAYNSGDFILARREWNEFARAMGQFHQTYDLYLTPTTATLPVRVGELDPRPFETAAMKVFNRLGLGRLLKSLGIAEKIFRQNISKTPFTQFVNFTGQPAMSVPLHWSADGFPCGVHFVAPFGEESLLFQVAGQLEKAKPWFDRVPQL